MTVLFNKCKREIEVLYWLRIGAMHVNMLYEEHGEIRFNAIQFLTLWVYGSWNLHVYITLKSSCMNFKWFFRPSSSIIVAGYLHAWCGCCPFSLEHMVSIIWTVGFLWLRQHICLPNKPSYPFTQFWSLHFILPHWLGFYLNTGYKGCVLFFS